MARIRTIKPEFWTDEKIVLLPYEARLLFIGIWNFADDYGYFWDEPARIKMQVLPNDDIDVSTLLDMLVSADLLNIYTTDDNDKRAYQIKHFEDHQKVDHPAKSKIKESVSRKLAIPLAARRSLALKYNCKPGASTEASCYYCGFKGKIYWQKLNNGNPGSWVYFQGLEIDHLEPESHGGISESTNLVLACRECNRSKHNKNLFEFIANDREESRCVAPEGNGKEGKGKEIYTPDFLEFWKAYPKKSGSKKVAFDYWKKLNGDKPPMEIILSAIEKQKAWRQNARDGDFRPEWKDAERWIKCRMWEFEVEENTENKQVWEV